MRIVLLTQVLPFPLDAGPKTRAYYVLRHLADRGHAITLVPLVRPSDRASDLRQVARYCEAVEPVPLWRSRLADLRHGARSLVSNTPFLILRDEFPAMNGCLRRVMSGRSFDAIHADQLWMAPYALRCEGVGLKVLDQHNAVYRVPQRLAMHERNPLVRRLLHREASKLAAYERAMLGTFDRVIWVSEDDRNAFPSVRYAERARHAVIPIAVDPAERRPLNRPRPFRITFLGGTHWPPNAEGVRWFADAIWPAVAESVPDAVFTVIGKGSLRRLGPAKYRRRVEVTGYLPDLDPPLRETAAFVVPLNTGAGMRVKILDAWCWALPIVSTRVGAEGIRTSDGENILLADEAADFADALIRVLTDAGLARRLSENGRATVETSYDWRKVYQAWEQVYH